MSKDILDKAHLESLSKAGKKDTFSYKDIIEHYISSRISLTIKDHEYILRFVKKYSKNPVVIYCAEQVLQVNN